jgi:phosphoglycolate phosphatase
MPTGKKLIIFDFDGTIADTLPIGYTLYQQSAEKYHLKKFQNYSDFQDFLQLSLPQMLFRLRVSPFLFKKIMEENITYSTQQLTDASLFPGIEKVIQQLAKRYVLVIVSSSFASVITAYLKKHHLHQYFHDICGSEVHKDKKEKIKRCLKNFNAKPSETILIGDSTRDIKDGKKMKVTTIAVAYGIHSLTYLEKEKPDAVAQTPEDILQRVTSFTT